MEHLPGSTTAAKPTRVRFCTYVSQILRQKKRIKRERKSASERARDRQIERERERERERKRERKTERELPGNDFHHNHCMLATWFRIWGLGFRV
jgi:hypothetical protein